MTDLPLQQGDANLVLSLLDSVLNWYLEENRALYSLNPTEFFGLIDKALKTKNMTEFHTLAPLEIKLFVHADMDKNIVYISVLSVALKQEIGRLIAKRKAVGSQHWMEIVGKISDYARIFIFDANEDEGYQHITMEVWGSTFLHQGIGAKLG